MPIIRKRNAAHKAYIPKNVRDNQYLLAEFNISDGLIQRFASKHSGDASQTYYPFYQSLSKLFFTMAEEFELDNCQFIANDKLARVRFNHEMHQWQTNQQILFYYNPSVHKLKKSFFDASVRAQKITLLFLASGDEIRIDAARFHAQVQQMLLKFCQKIDLAPVEIRLRDHQHLTYDLFTKNKGGVETIAHKLRPIPLRYHSQHVDIPQQSSAITYAVVYVPINHDILKAVDIDVNARDPYNPLYTFITDSFTLAAKQFNLNNGAIIANGLIPIVRHSIHDIISSVGELQILGYNPEHDSCGIVAKWDASKLVDNIQLIFVATKENKAESGFGHFLNQIEQAMRLMCKEIGIAPERDEIIMRFHQHIAYNLS